MDKSFKGILLEILNAIDFSQDKEKYIAEFIELTQIEAIESLITSRAPQDQEKIKTELTASANDPQKINAILMTYFSQEQYTQAFEKATTNAVAKWMQAIEPTLSDVQKQKLASISQELQNTSLMK